LKRLPAPEWGLVLGIADRSVKQTHYRWIWIALGRLASAGLR
jgi:hypothetical protein